MKFLCLARSTDDPGNLDVHTYRCSFTWTCLSALVESFSLCNPQFIEMVDNVPILQIDMVWCYFMLRDISSLSMAGIQLQKAREGIERAHGKDYSRVRLLQGGRYPEIALHLRLELLEGVVAYHSGHLDKSQKALTSAQEKFLKLQVPDESLSLVMSMGFKEHNARRALHMTIHDVGSAVDFLIEEKAKKLQKREEDMKRRLCIQISMGSIKNLLNFAASKSLME